ncbi:MAG: SDR family oxidoreductase, partial [Actinobacteria bacterium]|nr:SDR family oxidoreductase [Actinomycetota bacterium]
RRSRSSPKTRGWSASKAGVVALTASLASLCEGDRIAVTCICPDWVLTGAVERTVASMTEEERRQVPGLVPVEEIAGLIVRLVTDESLAGRVMVRWADEEGERLLPLGRA